MNRLATLATMPFLITYAAIEYSYFALCQQFEINQRRLQNYKVQDSQSPTFDKSAANGTGIKQQQVCMAYYYTVSKNPEKSANLGSCTAFAKINVFGFYFEFLSSSEVACRVNTIF